jgi:hypothetical protein
MRCLAVLLVAITAMGCKLPEPKEPSFLEVRVTVDGKPEAGASIGYTRQAPKDEPQWPPQTGSTDAMGVFRTVEIKRATYEVNVSVEGHSVCVSNDADWSKSFRPSLFKRTLDFEGEPLKLAIDVRCPLEVFAAEVAQYKELAARPVQQGEVAGRFIVMTPEGIDSELNWRLPEHLRPWQTSDVKMVVWIDRKSERVGYYVGGGPAYSSTFVVSLIDRERKVPIARQEFVAGAPAKIDSRFMIGVGGRPVKEIIDYLAQFRVPVTSAP